MATTDSMMQQDISSLESPRLRALYQALAESDDREAALDAFWQDVAAVGTPLVEAHDAVAGTALLTFLWREVTPVENVLLVEWITDGDFSNKGMVRLDGTDVWYRSMTVRDDLRTAYQIAPDDPLTPKREEKDWPARFARWMRDPLNTSPLVDPNVAGDAGDRTQSSSVVALPGAPKQPWIAVDPATPRGRVTEHRLKSEILDNTRDLWLYEPVGGFQPDAPVLVVFDGERSQDVMRVPAVLDNLVASGAVPPMVAVMVGNVERGEELPCNPQFLSMLTDELLPWVARTTGVEPVPSRTLATGVSYGGLAAMYAGLFAPEAFGLVVSQSGSFWWKPDPLNEQVELRIGDSPEYCWLPAQATDVAIRDVRIWMEVGTLEDRTHGSGGPSQVSANRHMRDVLRARGVPVIYSEYAGGHDYACWRNTLGDGIVSLLGHDASGR